MKKTLTINEVVETILTGIQRQRFDDWYSNGNFNSWISGDLPEIDDDEIKNDIQSLFNLNR